MKINLLILIFLQTQLCWAQNKQIKSFQQAKVENRNIYGNENLTFYCRCPYQANSIKSKRCKVETKKFTKRKSRLEWEHIVPAHAFGHSFKQWRENKTICKTKNKKFKTPRSCARQNKEFVQMESDIYNIVPVVGAINAIRNKYSMAMFNPHKSELCPGLFVENRKIMPPERIRGDIARIYFYMQQTYPGRGIISKKNIKLFQAWDKLDPVDKLECEITRKKQKIQKNINKVVISRCEKAGL